MEKKIEVAELFSKLIQEELDGICPEESMSRLLDEECTMEIVSCSFFDGKIHLGVKTEKGMRELILKPVGWQKPQ